MKVEYRIQYIPEVTLNAVLNANEMKRSFCNKSKRLSSINGNRTNEVPLRKDNQYPPRHSKPETRKGIRARIVSFSTTPPNVVYNCHLHPAQHKAITHRHSMRSSRSQIRIFNHRNAAPPAGVASLEGTISPTRAMMKV